MSSQAILRCKQEQKLTRSTISFAVISSRDTIQLQQMISTLVKACPLLLSIDLIDSNYGGVLTEVEITGGETLALEQRMCSAFIEKVSVLLIELSLTASIAVVRI